MWARLHKLDRVHPLGGGAGALVVIEDERSTAQMQRVPSLSILAAIARVLAARRALAAKFDGKGEVRYAAAPLPSFLSDAIVRAGAAIADASGDTVRVPAQPAGVSAAIDIAFAELAHHVRGAVGAADIGAALRVVEERRAKAPLDKDAAPVAYWTAVLELAALAGEQARPRGGRWIETHDLPVPFAIRFADGTLSHPTVVAQQVVEGRDPTPAPA